MNDGRRRFLIKQYLQEVIYWTIMSLSFIVIRFVGYPDAIADVQLFYDELSVMLLVTYSILFGLILGSVLASFRVFFQNEICSNLSVGQTLAMATFLQYLLFISLYVMIFFMRNLGLGYSVDYAFIQILNDDSWQNFIIISGVFIFASIQLNLFVEADKKLGLNVIGQLLLGKYHNPKQEQRVFMFLDMKDSTGIAEKLGHVSYSKLLQEVYKLLTDLVINHEAEIYQFVGDEVVLTWRAKNAHKENHVLDFFYSFLAAVELKKEDFRHKYGISPVFKAGVHEGIVSVAEVGEISTQIAYHGDVVNSTSRIQELCNEYNTNLLLSDAFVNNMSEIPTDLSSHSIDITLRGRSHKMTLFFPQKIAA